MKGASVLPVVQIVIPGWLDGPQDDVSHVRHEHGRLEEGRRECVQSDGVSGVRGIGEEARIARFELS